MTEVQYPDTTIVINSGTENTTLTPLSVVVGESIYDVSTTITPTSVTIFDNDPSFPCDMIILQNSIVSTNGVQLIQINENGFFATDTLGNPNAVSGGNAYITKADGTYINLGFDSGLNINGDIGSAGYVLQKSVPDSNMVWGLPPFASTATGTLDMATYGINNVGSIASPAGGTNAINGQVQFDTPPHIPDPILGNDAASKGYVDTLIGNYSGNGLTLYFNYATPQTDPIIAPSVGELQQTLAPINSPTVNNFYTMSSIASGVGTLISTFTTDVGFPNTLTIPTGLWSMLVWGYTTAQTGQLYYHFHLNEVSSAGVFIAQIGTSGFSSDVNAINSADPDAFHCSLALVAPYTMASVNSRLQIQIYTTGTGAVPLNLFTLFGGDYYSNVTSTLSGATSLLTQNNTWTGVNTFNAGFNTTAIDSATTLSLGTGTATTTTLGRATQTTAINGATIGLTGGTSATITAPTINLTGAVKSNNIDTASAVTLNIGNVTTNLLALGRAGLASITATATNMTLTGIVSFANDIKGTGTSLEVSQPITPTGLTYNTTNGTNITTAIGYRVTSTLTNNTTDLVAGTIKSMGAVATMCPVGVWLIELSFNINRVNTILEFGLSFNTTTINAEFYAGGQTTATGGNFIRTSYVVPINTAKDIYFTNKSPNIAAASIATIAISRTRIA